jgi:uncharacterized membrane protein HdeD (DUF308 family)
VGAALVAVRNRFSGLVDPEVLIELLGFSAGLTGLLRVVGGFATQERFGRRWTLGGIVLGTLELAFGSLLLLTSRVDPDLLLPIAATWGTVSGTLLLAEGLAAAPLRPHLAATSARGPHVNAGAAAFWEPAAQRGPDMKRFSR